MAKKKAPPPAAAAAAPVVEAPPAVFTPAEAKKLAKLLKASDRGKRLDAIRAVSENHGYITKGGCLLPLLESAVAKKKMEEVVKAAAQVIVDFLVGPDAADPTKASDATMAAMQEAKKKPAKYKLAEVLGNLVLNPDGGNSWNAVRSLRSMAATVESIPKDTPQAASLGAILTGPGQTAERLCSYFVDQSNKRAKKEGTEDTGEAGIDKIAPWNVERLYIVDTIGVMCGVSNDAVQTVVSSGAVPCLLRVLRSITESESTDMLLLTSTLAALTAVAKSGGEAATAAAAATATASTPRGEGGVAKDDADASRSGAAAAAAGGGGVPSLELEALANGGAWGAVHDTLKGPCMARVTELQQPEVASGKKGEAPAAVPDFAPCLDNMARCAEILRVMAMAGWGLDEEGALEAGVAAMSAILGMQGLPRNQAPVSNLMTGIMKAMGSIACLSENHRVKVCSAGAAPKVLALMAPTTVLAPTGVSAVAGGSLPLDTAHGRLMRKTAEKCLHHLIVSRVTWMADDRALCDTSVPPETETGVTNREAESDKPTEKLGQTGSSASGNNGGRKKREAGDPPSTRGPAYLSVDAVLAAANAESIDVRRRAIRLLSRLVSSRRCAMALGVSAVPSLGRLIAWWLRTKDNPDAHRTPGACEPTPPQSAKSASAGKAGAGRTGKTAAAAAAAAAKDEPEDEIAAAAALLDAKLLEELDRTTVQRDEALAYALIVMLEVVKSGRNERAAIGEDANVALVVSVVERLPCTAEEFYADSVERPSTSAAGNVGGDAVASSPAASAASTILPAAGAKAPTEKSVGKGTGVAGPNHTASRSANNGLSEPEEALATDGRPSSRPGTALDLSATLRRESTTNPRSLHCWRGEKSRDPEVALFSPLDWGWDFQVGVSQQPIQPGLILRAAALRVLLEVVAGYDPTVEAAATGGVTASPPSKASKGGAARAAAGGAGAELAASSDAAGARSVLNHALPVCLDLLSVDVYRVNEHGDTADEGLAGGSSNSNNNNLNSTQDGTAAASIDPGQQEGGGVVAARKPPAKLTVNMVSGLPVLPGEELVHEEIRVACLRLVGSLLRLGGVAREAFVSVADTHRNMWRTTLEEEDRQCIAPNATTTTTKPNKSATTAGIAGTTSGGCSGEGQRWVTPQTFCSWDLRGEGDLRPLRASLPYVRAVSTFLLPLRNPNAPVTNIMAALIALGRLCMEGEHEVGGAQPEPLPADCDSFQPLPSSREGTTGVLVDTLAGVAVSMGALVPLVSIWGCAVAATGSGELPPDITGMVNQCQTLIDYLIRRGHVRDNFWSSLPSLDQIAEAKAAAAEAAAPKKAERKSKGAGKGGKGGKGSSSPPAPEPEAEVKPVVPRLPPPPAGRPDPNLGPDQTCWRQLLNARADEQRTQTFGTTALLMATITGLETAVGSLLLAGADPNVRGYDGQSPLMCALGQGMDEAARGLVGAGADVDAVNLQGSSVLKCAFLCPPRKVMQNIIHQRSEAKGETLSIGSCSVGLENGPVSSRRGSARSAADDSSTGEGASAGRPRARTRRGSLNVTRSRSRSRSGSLTKIPRRSSFGRAISFDENSRAGAGIAPGSTDRRRLTRSSSASALDSARAALRDSGRRESTLPLKTPRGTTVVQGDSRMVPYILGCGADPNVSSGTGDFPLHWAVIGTELTVRIMNQNVRIVAAGGVANGVANGASNGGKSGNQTETEAGVDSTSASRETSIVGDLEDGQEDDLALLKVLVGAGSALDVCNRNGMTALHTAVIAGRGVLAGALLDAGASPNVSDSLGCLPLHYACLRAFQGYVDLARRLLALGMGRPLDKGVHRDLRKGKTRREKLLLDVANIMNSGLREATAPSSITHHRATCSELLNFVSVEGYTPLHYVCDGRVSGRHAAAAILALWQRRTSAPTVPLLPSCASQTVVESKADAGSTGGNSGDCERASDDRCVERVGLLRWLLSEPELDHKVRVPRGATTLHLAAQTPGSQGCELVRLLVQAGGVNLDALDAPAASSSGLDSLRQVGSTDSDSSGDGREADHLFSALHFALQAGSWETANILLSAGASVRPEGAYPSCIHVACRAGAPACLVEQLLERGGWLSSTPSEAPPLTAAQHDGDLHNVVWSVGSGAYAATPLFLAAATGSAEVVALLLATRSICIPPIEGGNGKAATPAVGGSTGGAGVYDSENTWSMKHSPSNDRSPLHAAAIGGHTAAAQALVDAELAFASGGSASSWLNTLDATGRTPLDLAVSKGKWECAQLLASADMFDVKLAVEVGPSSALLTAERNNMAIVDEGSGEASALSSLRESNKLIMALLKRLSEAATEDLSAAAAVAAAETSATITATGEEKEVVGGTDADALAPSHDRAGLVVCVNATDGGTVSATTATVQPDEGDGSGSQQSIDPVSESVPKIQHLHSCFAEGVLYSNAKGVFVPDTPGRKKRMPSQPIAQLGGESGGFVVDEVDEDQHRAAVIIQSRARQAEAKRVVAAKESSTQETAEHPSAPEAVDIGEPGGTTVSGTMNQEKASIVIQSQVRQAKARPETTVRIDQQRENTSGEVGAVVVTRIQTTQPAIPAGGG